MPLRIDSWNKGFMLRDENLLDSSIHGSMDDDTWSGKFKGKLAVLRAINYEEFDLNPTTYAGRFPLFWMLLTIVPAHAGAKIVKFDEEISYGNPMHKSYMHGLEHQKHELETKIKQGLVTVSQSVADLELLEHDLRKYKEYEKYLDVYFDSSKKHTKEWKIADKFLKMIFVEQVDYYVGSTGQGPGRFSMAFLRNQNLMPTIVDDFLEIKSLDDIEMLFNNKRISGAEKNVLLTKFKAYEEWLNMFKEAVKTRVKRLEELKRSREKTLEEFKEWVKPHIIRLKALNMTLEKKGKAGDYKKFERFTQITGMYRYKATLWIIKEFPYPWDRPEYRKKIMEYEFTTKEDDEEYKNPLNPYNKWTRENLVFNYDYGLLADYPWITKEWADNAAEEAWGWMKERKPFIYYLFIHIVVKNDIYSPVEIEDVDFIYHPFLLSHNAVLVKIMENSAHQKEFDFEIEEFIGHLSHVEGKHVVTYHKKGGKYELTRGFINKWLKASYHDWVYKIHGKAIDDIKSKLKSKDFDLNSSIVLNKKEFKEIFPDDKFYAVENFKENKILSYVEDNIFGHYLRLSYGLPYQTNFTDAVTYMMYRQMAKMFQKLVVKNIMSALEIPGKDGF